MGADLANWLRRFAKELNCSYSRVTSQTVDFDFAVQATAQDGQGGLAAYLGFTLRSDTGFAELIAVALNAAAADVTAPCLVVRFTSYSRVTLCFWEQNRSSERSFRSHHGDGIQEGPCRVVAIEEYLSRCSQERCKDPGSHS